jgi:hypothetical protein
MLAHKHIYIDNYIITKQSFVIDNCMSEIQLKTCI